MTQNKGFFKTKAPTAAIHTLTNSCLSLQRCNKPCITMNLPSLPAKTESHIPPASKYKLLES